jgi:hypothetical protein
MSRELRTTLGIMLCTLLLGAPLIFANAPQAQGTSSYLALVFQLAPSATPPGLPTITPRLPRPTKTPTATPTLPPPTFNGCQADPNPAAAPHYPIRIMSINKVAETVTLQNVSTTAISLSGWTMCSITGNQQHPIGGTLAAGQSQTFPGPAGSIWNNTAEDDGALYNPSGQLVSYFNN